MSQSNLLQSLFKYKAWANEPLVAELATMDAEANAMERHTAIRLLSHVRVVDRIFAARLCGVAHDCGATNTAETPTLESSRQAVAEADCWYVEHGATLMPTQLEERLSFRFTDGSGGGMSREEMLAHVATHGGCHRGAVGRIMALAGVPPPRDIFTVYLHRAEPGRRSARRGRRLPHRAEPV
jgi:uncharacterized damage-inducible protein DinB